MIIKSGRKLYKLNKKDRIMHRFNNCWDCYELLTQPELVKGSYPHTFLSPQLTKCTVEQLIKEGKLVLAKDKYVDSLGASGKYDLYRIR